MSETDISRAIQKALRSLGCMVVRVHSGAFRVGSHWVKAAEAGCPDYICLTTDARTIWLETKTATGKLSDEQIAWHERARAMGHRVVTVRSVAEAVAAVRTG